MAAVTQSQLGAIAPRRQQRTTRESDVEESSSLPEDHSMPWLADEVCSVCSLPVDKPGSLYCSQACKHQDESASRGTSSSASSPSRSVQLSSKPMLPSASEPALPSRQEGQDASSSVLAGLRYAPLPSPSTTAQLRSPVQAPSSSRHRQRASISHAGTIAPLSPMGLAPKSPRRVSASPAMASPTKWRQRGRSLVQGDSATQRRSASSSSTSSSLSDASSSDPTTPSPHLWANSAPHAHNMVEPSAFMLPPSVHTEHLSSPQLSAVNARAAKSQAESLPASSTLASFMRFTRRPSSTNQPAPVLFSSPRLMASKVGAIASPTAAKASGTRSARGTPAFGPARSPLTVATAAKAGSGSDTSDLDLRDGDLSSGSSSSFSLGPSLNTADRAERRSPLSRTVALPSTSVDTDADDTAEAHTTVSPRRLVSESAVTLRSPKMSDARPLVPHAKTAPSSITTTVQDGSSEAGTATGASASTNASAANGSGPRGRSRARGPRSSSRRRSPSPPRHADRRSSRPSSMVLAESIESIDRDHERQLAHALASSPDLDFGGDDEREPIDRRHDAEEPVRGRGRQARRSSGLGAISEQPQQALQA